MELNPNVNNMTGEVTNKSGNMYSYNDEGSNNPPPKEFNAFRRNIGEGINPYKLDQNNISNNEEDQNVEQNAIRRSLGDKNPNNADFPNYEEKSSEQRIDNLKNNSPFRVVQNPLNQYESPGIYRPDSREAKKNYFYTFFLIFLFQFIFIIILPFSYDYCYGNYTKEKEISVFSYYYNFFKDVHLMIFIGFGLLYTSLKDHQWSSVSIVLFMGILSFEISFIWYVLWANTFINSIWDKISLNFDNLTKIDYISATVLISLGVLIGKLSISQYFLITICETFIAAFNYCLCYGKLQAIDNGGSLYIHTFGAIFGIVVSIVNFCPSQEFSKISSSPHLNSDYYSNIFSFIGSLFLWLYFPSFNTANIQCLDNDNKNCKNELREIFRYRGIMNTYLSLVGSAIAAFVVSPLVSNGKLKIDHLLHSSYVGGIIIGGCCTICPSAWGAILIGFIGGCLSVLGLWKIKKYFKEKKLEDTFGILFTFGIPGILGGFLNSIFMGNFGDNKSWYGYKLERYFIERSFSVQAGVQIAAIFITLAFAVIGGITIGFFIKMMKCDKNDIYFVDSEYYYEDDNIPLPEWKYPRINNINLSSSGNKLDMNEREVVVQQ